MAFDAIRALVRDEMSAVDDEIQARLTSDVALIHQLANYIIGSGGKRLRPLVVLLTAKALGYAGTAHVRLAAIIEFIHTATLLHDDVVDASELRRGHSTANSVWGNEASVLVGDFLYSRSFEMMVDLDSMRVMEILAQTTNTIARGEVLQLLNVHDPDTTEARYYDVIRSKTAKLFEAAARLGAVITQQPREIEEAVADYGLHVGMAFQLTDDRLDYGRDNPSWGKNVGDDLAEGNPTLPLIHALQHGNDKQRALIRSAVENGGQTDVATVVATIESLGSLAYTARRAEEEAELARKALIHGVPDSPYKQSLFDLAFFSVHRTY